MSEYKPSTPPGYLSATSANALISDIQPTSIAPAALSHINLFLDEILYNLLENASSLNPADIRSNGVPAIFAADKNESTSVKALGRSAVGEAELELRSWIESNGSLGRDGFGRDGKGTGMKRGGFALQQAYEVMRGKCEEFSTLAGDDGPRQSTENNRLSAWTAAGGSAEEKVLSPAALYITAILEHVCEHVLSALARVISRDSGSTTASVEDLFTAMAEDASIWGFFKKMQTRVSLEEAVKSRQKRAVVSRASGDSRGGRGTPASAASQTSLVQSTSSGRDTDSKKTSHPPSAYDSRASHESPRSSAIRKSPSLPTAARFGAKEHVRSPSVLSAGTRNTIGAYNEQVDGDGISAKGRSKREEEDDFDALMASGETMKVSLTPSRLKTFENGRRSTTSSPTQVSFRRDRAGASPAKGDELPPLLPANTPPRSAENLAAASRGSARTGSARVLQQPKLQARSGSILAEEDAEELDDEAALPRGPQRRKESLAELLAESEYAAVQEGKRTVPAVILGSAPPKFDDDQNHPQTASAASSIRPIQAKASPAPAAPAKKRTPAQEMADFFNDGPPVPASPAPRTDARDMADFFNSTSPPASSSRFGSPVENIAPIPKKGFKGFMSKIGGGRNKERKASWDASQAQSPEEIPTAGGSSWAGAKGYMATGQNLEGKRQKSMASMATTNTQNAASVGLGIAGASATSATAVAVAYRDQQQQQQQSSVPPVPPVPSKSPLAPGMPVESAQPAQAPAAAAAAAEEPSGSTTTPQPASAGAAGMPRKVSLRKPVRYIQGVDPQITPDANVPPSPSSSPRPQIAEPATSAPARKPSTVDEDISSDETALSQPVQINDVPGRASALREQPSNDHMSFMTASESITAAPVSASSSGSDAQGTPRAQQSHEIDSVPEVAGRLDEIASTGPGEAGDAALDTVPEAAPIRNGAKADLVSDPEHTPARTALAEPAADDDYSPTAPFAAPSGPQPQSSSSPPSIPLSDLVGLRHLLSHASSVKECQLLLSAVLSQLGVPLSSADEPPIDPETRIAAWLLGGGGGPGVEYGRANEKNGRHRADESRSSEGEEQLKTPKMAALAQVGSDLQGNRKLSHEAGLAQDI